MILRGTDGVSTDADTDATYAILDVPSGHYEAMGYASRVSEETWGTRSCTCMTDPPEELDICGEPIELDLDLQQCDCDDGSGD